MDFVWYVIFPFFSHCFKFLFFVQYIALYHVLMLRFLCFLSCTSRVSRYIIYDYIYPDESSLVTADNINQYRFNSICFYPWSNFIIRIRKLIGRQFFNINFVFGIQVTITPLCVSESCSYSYLSFKDRIIKSPMSFKIP